MENKLKIEEEINWGGAISLCKNIRGTNSSCLIGVWSCVSLLNFFLPASYINFLQSISPTIGFLWIFRLLLLFCFIGIFSVCLDSGIRLWRYFLCIRHLWPSLYSSFFLFVLSFNFQFCYDFWYIYILLYACNTSTTYFNWVRKKFCFTTFNLNSSV